ncbi:MAG TPA: hypothetical protein PLD02_10865, partial [Saprospiraceae bacterium]|nr:hypothetical protein [Saprospiraceae bacterium]
NGSYHPIFGEKQIDFSDCMAYLEKAYNDVEAKEGKKLPDFYLEVKKEVFRHIFVKPIKCADETTNHVYNRLDALWRAIPHDTY